MTKDYVLHMLQEHPDEYVSGGMLSETLKLSRTAVWKAVEQLRAEGYPIESMPRRGHRLSSDSDVLSEEGVRRHLKNRSLRVSVYPVISSTNTVLKQMAAEDAPEGQVLIAGEQTAGRGRLGRSFYSPAGTGQYMSLLLRPSLAPADATRLTACAAVAVCEALESLGEVRLGIKWVNDICLKGRKICGILTEAGLDFESGKMSYVIIGIGVNTRLPKGDFPEEIRQVAGSAFGDAPVPDLRNRLAAGVLDRLAAYAADPFDPAVFRAYKARSLALGQPILILSPGQDPIEAEALDLAEDFSLRVRLGSGEERQLRSGEISIRLKE